MLVPRQEYSRELKIACMRELDSGKGVAEVARQYQLSPKRLEMWKGEWRAKGELAFPGKGARPQVECTPKLRQETKGPGRRPNAQEPEACRYGRVQDRPVRQCETRSLPRLACSAELFRLAGILLPEFVPRRRAPS